MDNYGIGTRVKYGLDRDRGHWTDIGTIRGFTRITEGTFYAVESKTGRGASRRWHTE